jgi:hypothetical protein
MFRAGSPVSSNGCIMWARQRQRSAPGVLPDLPELIKARRLEERSKFETRAADRG